MEITEVRIFLKESPDKKLKAYATITIDNCFVVRNVKVIEGTKGLFVAMPSRKVKEPCPKCRFRNVVRSKFCNNCGSSLPQRGERIVSPTDDAARQSEHRDIAHPITTECRDYIQKKILSAYDQEHGKPQEQRAEPEQRVEPEQRAEPAPRPAPEPIITHDIDEDSDIEL